MTEWVSARGAAEILGCDGFSRTMSRRVLATGLAGEPLRTAGATLYDAARVRSLLERPSADVDHLPSPCDQALLEVRVAAGSTPDDSTPDDSTPGDSTPDDMARTGTVRIGNAGAVVRLHLEVLAERLGFLPAVFTCCSFVLWGGEVTGTLGLPDGHSYLQVRPPGAWFECFADRRLHSTAGNPWRLWLQPAAA